MIILNLIKKFDKSNELANINFFLLSYNIFSYLLISGLSLPTILLKINCLSS